MDEDLGRYESAVGWRRRDPYKKQRERVRAQQEREERLVRPILHSPNGAQAKPPEQLFTSLWQTGEVALLFGPPGVGKSIFAVRLAEAISRGEGHLLTGEYRDSRSPEGGLAPALGSSPVTCHSPLRVVYIDLQRTESQFHQRFPDVTIERRHFDWSAFDADQNDNIRAGRVQNSIYEAIEDGAEVIILDDITLGGINIGRPQGPLRTLRTLKMFAAEHGTSILVIAGSRPRMRPRPAALSDVAFRHIAELADSVFCLSASTYGPAFRYIRHLRATSGPIVHDASAVLTYQLGGVSSPITGAPAVASTSGVEAVNAGASSEDNSSCIVHSASCIQSLRFLGDCAESEHLRDYAAEAEQAKKRELKALRKPKGVVNMLMSKEYWKYQGE